MVIRWIAAVAAFVAVILIGAITIGDFGTGIDPDSFFDAEGANSFALIGAIALVVAFVVYAGVEYAQTGGLGSIARQFVAVLARHQGRIGTDLTLEGSPESLSV